AATGLAGLKKGSGDDLPAATLQGYDLTPVMIEVNSYTAKTRASQPRGVRGERRGRRRARGRRPRAGPGPDDGRPRGSPQASPARSPRAAARPCPAAGPGSIRHAR